MTACWGFGYAPNSLWNYAYNFDGATNYLEKTSNFTGITDSSRGIINFWVYSTGTNEYILNGYDGANEIISITNPGAGAFIQLSLTDGANTFVVRSNDALTGSQWNLVQISWDTNFTTGNKIAHIYINGSSSGNTISVDDGAFSADYSAVTKWTVGAQASSGGALLSRCLAQFYFQPGSLLDFSVSGNRDKFQSSGDPIFIGRQGENPTGTAALLYLTSSVANVGLNSGTGGNFDTIHGTFTNCASVP